MLTLKTCSAVLLFSLISPQCTLTSVHATDRSCRPCVGYPTRYQQGSLTVEVTGPTFNVIEAYYNEAAYRSSVSLGSNLHVNRVFLAPGNNGLFALRCGPHNTKFLAVGWAGGNVRAIDETSLTAVAPTTISAELNLQLGNEPIHVAWKSDWVVRLSRTRATGELTCILRWKSGNWEMLKDNTWLLLVP